MTKEPREALESGELTDDQLRELIEHDASELSLTFDEAVRAARSIALPKTPAGFTLRELVRLLDMPILA